MRFQRTWIIFILLISIPQFVYNDNVLTMQLKLNKNNNLKGNMLKTLGIRQKLGTFQNILVIFASQIIISEYLGHLKKLTRNRKCYDTKHR